MKEGDGERKNKQQLIDVRGEGGVEGVVREKKNEKKFVHRGICLKVFSYDCHSLCVCG